MRRFLIIVLIASTLFGVRWAVAQDAAVTYEHTRSSVYQSVTITPSDTVYITATWGIWNGAAAACNINLTLNGEQGTISHVFDNVQPGTVLPVQAIRVWSTNTGCTNLLGLYDK